MIVLGYGNSVGKVGGDEGDGQKKREKRQESSVNVCYFFVRQEYRQDMGGYEVIQIEERGLVDFSDLVEIMFQRFIVWFLNLVLLRIIFAILGKLFDFFIS